MELSIRPMKQEEITYSYTHDADIMQNSGCIGLLRGDMGSDGLEFYTSWFDHTPSLKTPEFISELDVVVNSFRIDNRFGGLFRNRPAMASFCNSSPNSAFKGNYTTEYGFRADTDQHSYMLRCNPTRGDYNFYLYCFNRSILDQHLETSVLVDKNPSLSEQIRSAEDRAFNKETDFAKRQDLMR